MKYSKKKRKAIISTLKVFLDEHDSILSQEVKDGLSLDPAIYFKKIVEILKSSDEMQTNLLKARSTDWTNFSKLFDTQIELALKSFIENSLLYGDVAIHKNDSHDYYIISLYADSFIQKIYFKEAFLSENFNEEICSNSEFEIDATGETYRLSFLQNEEIITMDFTDIMLRTDLLNYFKVDIESISPWERISKCLNSLSYKMETLGFDFLNEQEKELLPLNYFHPIHNVDIKNSTSTSDEKSTKLFYDLALKNENETVAALTKQYANSTSKNIAKTQKALTLALKELKSEPLARDILMIIKQAVEDLPSDLELKLSPESIKRNRETVTNIMIKQGYCGEYPHFKKMSAIKGAKIIAGKDQPILIVNEKNMACIVDCHDTNFNENIFGISFLTSTIFLKKKETQLYDSLDGYSGYFPPDNRRNVRHIHPNLFFGEDGELTYDLELITTAAAKKTEYLTLDKQERQSILSFFSNSSSLAYYLAMFLGTGIMFAILLCIGFFSVALLIGTPFILFANETVSFSEYLKMLLSFPWWKMFLFCVIGFGLPITLITAFTNKLKY